MFGNKKKKLEKAKLEREKEANKQLEIEKQKQHEELVDRYNKAREYDRRVAKGEDPLTVEEEIYGSVSEPVVSNTFEPEVQQIEEKEEIEEVTEVEDETSVEEENEEDEVTEENEVEEDEAVEETSVEEEPKAKKTTTKKTPAKKTTAKKASAAKPVKLEDANVKVLSEAEPDDKTNGKYEIFQESGGYKYRIVASNGQILATSEVYTKVQGAQNGIKTLKANLDSLEFHIETDKHRKSQFIGVTSQNKMLVTSANYSSKKAAESAIDSFKNFALATKILLLNDEDESKPELVDRSQFNSTAAKGKYVILFNQEGLTYQFALKASNGQLIVTSKFYKSDVSCKAAIAKFKKDVKDGQFYIVRDKNGNYEFRLYNASNRLVQDGISFASKTRCLSNIESVIRFVDSDLED